MFDVAGMAGCIFSPRPAWSSRIAGFSRSRVPLSVFTTRFRNPVDGGNFHLRGADAGFRTGHSGDAAVGFCNSQPLARHRCTAAVRVGEAWVPTRPVAADELCGVRSCRGARLFLVATAAWAAGLGDPWPWIATVLMLAVASPYCLWLRLAAGPLSVLFAPDRPAGPRAIVRLAGVGETLFLAHAGLLVLGGHRLAMWGGGAENVPAFRRNRCTISRAGSCFSFFSHRCSSRSLWQSGPVLSKRPVLSPPYCCCQALWW